MYQILCRDKQHWTKTELKNLMYYYETLKGDFVLIAINMQRSVGACRSKYYEIYDKKGQKEDVLSN